jgi:hypothetical protein
MAQAPFLGKERVGRVTVEQYQDKYIRLRWTLDGKTYSMNVGNDSRETIKAARAKAQIIDGDIIFNSFDSTLQKYGRETKPTVLSVVKPEISLRSIWDKFVTDKTPHLKAKTADEYKAFSKLLDRLGDGLSFNALETKQALLAITTEEPNTTPYNCRDTFITSQLLRGVAPAIIAAWCDTSVRTIERCYADAIKLASVKPID